MYIPVEIKLKSYVPLHIEKGMLFVSEQKDGMILYVLDHSIPDDLIDQCIATIGAPVKFSLCDEEGNELVDSYEIGWFRKEENADISTLTLRDVNTILQDYDGLAELEILDYDFFYNGTVTPKFVNQKVILRMLSEELFEDDGSMDMYPNGASAYDEEEFTKNIE
jgi:hypothetical protein